MNQIGWYLPPQRYVRWNQTAVARLYVDELAVVDGTLRSFHSFLLVFVLY